MVLINSPRVSISFRMKLIIFVFAEPVKPSSQKPYVEREEPEKIKKWREEQQKRLTEKGEMFDELGVGGCGLRTGSFLR